MTTFLIYGANGYTGSLIASEAVVRGMRPVLAGRNGQVIEPLARKLGLHSRIFSLDNPIQVEEGIREMKVVLHCAGPFSHTWQAMANACLRTKTHYLDITGEAQVFENLAALDGQARAAQVILLPGVGFDVVPSDCLAVHLKRRLPTATHLALAIQSLSHLSRGTATTIIENIHQGGLVRQGGVLKKVPPAWKTRTIDFGEGPVRTMTIPWGDVAAAFYSTGIPNIEVYLASPLAVRLGARVSRFFGWALGSSLVQGFLKRRIQAGPAGPSPEERARGRSLLWAEVTDTDGKRAEARLEGPEGYSLTCRTALKVVERILAGQAQPGFQTPATAFGPDFILEVEGMSRQDI